MHLTPTILVLAGALLCQAAHASSAQRRNLGDLSSERARPFAAHKHRTRGSPYRNGSLRKRCTRKAVKQLFISNDDNVEAESSSEVAQESTSSDEDQDRKQGDDEDQEQASISNITSSMSVPQDVNTQGGSWLKKNCVTWGWIVDDGDKQYGAKGTKQSPAEIDSAVGTPSKYFGTYAHIDGSRYKRGDPSTYFDGREARNYVHYLKGTGAVAVLSVMPIYGWGGLTSEDNTQALQTVKMLKEFIDADIEVVLRFGHEVNWYTRPNSDDKKSGRSYYAGHGREFIEGWKTMAAAVRSAYPQVKLFWCPNIGSAKEYEEFWPGADTVDIVGLDYYPKQGQLHDLVSHVQEFHDKYALAHDLPFHIGETGTIFGNEAKKQWIETITSEETCRKLPKFEAVSYFNYNKEGDFTVAQPGAAGFTRNFVSLMQ